MLTSSNIYDDIYLNNIKYNIDELNNNKDIKNCNCNRDMNKNNKNKIDVQIITIPIYTAGC